MSKYKPRLFYDEPNMSDASILMKLEDVIGIALGPSKKNVVDFKLLQTILYILARQMRLLEQRVEIRVSQGETQRDDESHGSEDETPERETKSPRPVDRKGKLVRDDRPGKDGRGASQGRDDREDTLSTNFDEQIRKSPRIRDNKTSQNEKDKEESKVQKEWDRKEKDEKSKDKRGKNNVQRNEERDISSGRSESEGKRDNEKQEILSGYSDGIKSKGGEIETSSMKDKKRRGYIDRDEEHPKRSRRDKETERYKEDNIRTRSEDRAKPDERSSGKEIDRSIKDKDRGSDMVRTDRERGTYKESDQRYSASDEDQSVSDVDGYRPKEDGKRKKDVGKTKPASDTLSIQERGKSTYRERDMDRSEKDIDSIRLDKGKSTSRDRNGPEKDTEKLIEKGKTEESEYGKKKELGRSEKGLSKKSSGTSIAVSEVERQREKVLVVDRVPTTRPSGGAPLRVGSIEVVTLSQFKLLEKAVKSLEETAGPLPLPTLPENKKLRSDIVKGSASLTDTMQAMQISARVQAAEKAIGRLTELMTQLAATGALPRDLAVRAGDIKADVQALSADTQSLRKTETDSIAPSLKKGATSAFRSNSPTPSTAQSQVQAQGPRKSVQIDHQPAMPRPVAGGGAVASRPSVTGSTVSSKRQSFLASVTGDVDGVTPQEMDYALLMLRDDLFKHMTESTAAATEHADSAIKSARALAQKLDELLKLDGRVSVLVAIVADHSQQMGAYDAGIVKQLHGFQEQIQQMRNELTQGLSQLENVNNNTETAAVSELMERYENLVLELDGTVHGHQALEVFQLDLGNELKNLVECVEMLREEKADRDEVSDRLRDKADMERLSGLMTETEFYKARANLENSILMCNNKFYKQEEAFKRALKDFSELIKCKVQYMHLLALKEDTERQMQDLHNRVKVLARLLGDPKAAVLARQLSRDGVCAACREPALMAPRELTHGAPHCLPAVRRAPVGAEHPDPDEACLRQWNLEEPPEGRAHTCHRWAGGSHTVVSDLTRRERAPPMQVQAPPVKRCTGVGIDGKIYNLEEELLPCVECNQLSTGKENIPGEADDAPPLAGAGDQVNVISDGNARRVTIIHEEGLKHAQVIDNCDRAKSVDLLTLSKSAMAFTVKSSTTLDDGTPKRDDGIGNIIRGRSMVVDDSAVLRAAIKHHNAARVAEELKRAVAEDGEDERSSGDDDDDE